MVLSPVVRLLQVIKAVSSVFPPYCEFKLDRKKIQGTETYAYFLSFVSHKQAHDQEETAINLSRGEKVFQEGSLKAVSSGDL